MTYINGFLFSSNTAALGLRTYKVPGTDTFLRVRSDIAPLLVGFATEYNRRVERLRHGWCWSYAYRPVRGSSSPSFHGAGIAIDLNAPLHGLGSNPRSSFSPSQIAIIHALCRKYGLRWGGDYNGRKDPMHFEVILSKPAALALVRRLQAPSKPSRSHDRPPVGKDKYPYPGKIVRRGWSNSLTVKRIQIALGFKGRAVDGDFGPATERAVKVFQKRNHLAVDGLVGRTTWGRLF